MADDSKGAYTGRRLPEIAEAPLSPAELRLLGLEWFADDPNRARQLEMAMKGIEAKAQKEPEKLIRIGDGLYRVVEE